MLIFRVLALICVVVILASCAARETEIQAIAHAKESLDIANQILTEQDKQKCVTDFKQTPGLRNRDTSVVGGQFKPDKLVTAGAAKDLLVKGDTELASKIVVFITDAGGEGWARLPRWGPVVCYYKVENNKLVFLTSCYAGKQCPYYCKRLGYRTAPACLNP